MYETQEAESLRLVSKVITVYISTEETYLHTVHCAHQSLVFLMEVGMLSQSMLKGKHHIEMAKAASTSQSVTSFFLPQLLKGVNEAETRWSLFVAKHNISFLTSDHATKSFKAIIISLLGYCQEICMWPHKNHSYCKRGSCTSLSEFINC